MFPEETRGRQAKLADCVRELSIKPLDVEKEEHLNTLGNLQMIYKDDFRHSYSDFFPVLLEISREDNEYNFDFLTNNLQKLRDFVEDDYSHGGKEYGNIYSSFTKLCDHLNLQISQIIFFAGTANNLDNALKQINQTKEKLNAAQEELEQATAKANSLQTELVVVLSIFAAIVMTFSGGFSLMGNVIATITDTIEIEKIIIVALICGLFFFDTLFLMMYLVAKITGRGILSKCVTDDCSCRKSLFGISFRKCGCFNRLRLRLPYVYYFNILCIIGIIITCIEWYL